MGGTFSCCQPEIAVNRHIVRPIRQIGEGAYSQVYEVPPHYFKSFIIFASFFNVFKNLIENKS